MRWIAALVMNVISGHDKADSTSATEAVPDYTKGLTKDLKGMKIGIPKEYFVEGMQPEVDSAIKEAIHQLEELGAKVDWDVSLPQTPHALAVYYIIAPSEASANLARYDGSKYGFSYLNTDNMWEGMEKTKQFGFGPEVKRRIMLGTYALSSGYYDAYYLKAQKVRTLIRREFDAAFEKYDALVTPTSPTVPFKIGEKADNPLQMYLSDVCTLPINIAGVPGISIPAGFAQRTAHRDANHRQAVLRRNPAQNQLCLPAGHRLAQKNSEAVNLRIVIPDLVGIQYETFWNPVHYRREVSEFRS